MNTQTTEFVFTLLSASGHIERRLNRALASIKGVSFTEYNLLHQLRDSCKGSATRVELAAAVHLTPSAVTRALKPLEKIGYITSEKSERDARQSIATLTAAGETLLKEAEAVLDDEISSMSIPAVGKSTMTTLGSLLPR